MEKIKILQVVSCLEKGGTEAYIVNNFRHIDRERFSFDFLVFVEKEYPYYTDIIHNLGGRIFFCGVPSLKRIPIFLYRIISVIKKYGPYQAVHSHVNIANSWVLVATKLAGVPIRISHSHDTSGKDSDTFLRKAYIWWEELLIKKNATHFLACSTLAGEYLYGKEFFAAKGIVSHNGIDIAQFIDINENKQQALKEELDIADHIIFGNITRFEPKKNTLFTIDVFAKIVKKYPNAVLLLGGPDGGLLENVKSRVHKLGLDGNVRFIGVRNDVPDLLHLMDVYLFPSLFEGLGIVALEAQAAGVYIIASKAVPREVDMGLGLIEFCSLDVDQWVTAGCKHIFRKQQDRNMVIKQFRGKGYLIEESVKEIADIYEGEIGHV